MYTNLFFMFLFYAFSALCEAKFYKFLAMQIDI